MRTCSKCGKKGHNSRTCTVKNVAPQSVTHAGKPIKQPGKNVSNRGGSGSKTNSKSVEPGSIPGSPARPLRMRYVEAGVKCLGCGKNFYPARTISGVSNERYCSGNCAWTDYNRGRK